MKCSRGIALLALVAFALPAAALDSKHLPGDSEIIFSINFQQILNSPLLKGQADVADQLKDALKGNPAGDQVMRYLKKAGFDVFRDLKSMTVAAPGNGDPKAGIIIVEAKLDENKFYDAAEEAANDSGDVVRVKKNGSRRFLAVTPPDEKKHAYISMVSPGVLVASSTEQGLKSAWNRAEGESQGALKKEIQNLLAGVGENQSLTFVASGPALAKMLKEAPGDNTKQAVAMVEKIAALTASIAIGKDIEFQVAVGMPDAASAKQLAQQAVFGLALAKEVVKQKAMEDKRLEPAVDVVNSLRASAEMSNVVVRGVITGEAIEALIKSNLKN